MIHHPWTKLYLFVNSYNLN